MYQQEGSSEIRSIINDTTFRPFLYLKLRHNIYRYNPIFRNGEITYDITDAVKTHPIIISQDFIPVPYTSNPHYIETINIEGLAKLFAYGNFVRARLEQNGMSMESILEMELKKYNYTRKIAFQKPYFSPVDLSGVHEGDFHAALTDSGVCMVYNGNTMEGTYKSSTKVKELSDAFDKRDTIDPKKIEGTGRIFEKVFWLNLQDR